jgi:hypothetical protein
VHRQLTLDREMIDTVPNVDKTVKFLGQLSPCKDPVPSPYVQNQRPPATILELAPHVVMVPTSAPAPRRLVGFSTKKRFVRFI